MTLNGTGIRSPFALLAACLAVLVLTPAIAHEVDSKPMRFERIGMDEGLSQSAVNQIVQDSTGFMWFATENGLDRFDGYEFLHFRRDRTEPKSLPNDFVTDLEISPAGDLWVATDGGGLARREAGRRVFTSYRHDPADPATLPDDSLRTLLADPRGWIWVGTMRHGLSRLDVGTGRFTHFRHEKGNPASLSDDRVYALWLDRDGVLWVGTAGGLDRLDARDGAIRRYGSDANGRRALGDSRVLSVLRDRAGTLWVGTERRGLNRLDEDTGEFESFRHDPADASSLASDRVEAIFEDSAGRFWIGTTGGLSLMDRQHAFFTNYTNEPADASTLSNDYVISIFEDRGGVLWFGTKTGGLNRWNPRSWALGHRKPTAGNSGGLSSGNITSFTHDRQGRLWVGTYGGGINVYDQTMTTITKLRHDPGVPDSLSDDRVMALATASDGSIWVGTMQGGLNRIDPETREAVVYRNEPDRPGSLPADGIMSLYVSRAGELWVGTFGGGVSRYDPVGDRFESYRHDANDPRSLSSPNATAIGEDAEGTIWVGTSSGGVNRLAADGESWIRYDHLANDEDSLSASAVYAIHTDASGRLWVGTRAGLNRFVPAGLDSPKSRFRTITQNDGLANDVIYGIRSDREGRLWLSTNHGVSRYDPETGRTRNYHVSHGLQGEEFNFGAHYQDAEGRIYFGGNNGFNAFDPAELDFKSEPPPVALTGFNKLNRPVPTAVAYEALDELALEHTDDMVSFQFAALDYASPEQNQYAYMLEGFDQDWVEAGKVRRATYTDLDGGSYTFRVKAANSDGVWNEDGVSLRVAVEHPPWLTWWAYLGYVVLGFAIVFGVYRAQRRKLEREAEYSRRLETEVRDRTRELADRNSELQVANAKLHEASHTDALTGLRNRRYLFEQISKDIDLVQRHHDGQGRSSDPDRNNDIAFVMVDLDHFKPVNDSCGHTAGDRMLLQVRDALINACRSSDVVIRWGGDEFLVIGREATGEEVSALAERIRSRIAQTVFALGNGQVARTTCSIGFASYPFFRDAPDLLTWEQVLGIADVAMYRAKEERNAWVGMHGVEWSDSGESLVQALQDDADSVAEDGHIRFEQSLSLADEKLA